MDGKRENLALQDVAILWSKRVKVGSKTRQNRLVNLSISLSTHKIYTQLLLSEFLLSLNSNLDRAVDS